MESKTPVTILQELLMKMHVVPIYTLIVNGSGTHDPIFKYEVSAMDKKAFGTGKSKKEAKHDAAQQLLQVMSGLNSGTDDLPDDVISPYEGMLKENAVGELLAFCVTHQLQLPEYIQTRDEGLPHAKVFSWRCKVSSFTTEATARTKKNSKHMAALEMLSKLKESLGDVIETRSADPAPAQDGKDYMDIAVDKAIERMPRNIQKLSYRSSYGLNLKDTCFALTKERMPDLAYLDSLKEYGSSWFNSQDKENFQHIFSRIAAEIECQYNLRQMDSSNQEVRVVVLTVESMPSWTFMATGETAKQAVDAVFEEAVKFMVQMRI